MLSATGPSYHQFPVGGSVVLKAAPEGPVLTVIDIDADDPACLYTVAWLDDDERRHQARYTEADLRRKEA
jgi:hypothetical protein